MKEPIEVRVTKIKNRWHARLFYNEIVIDEMACDNKLNIGFICFTMLRWADKLGFVSPMAHAARQRQKAEAFDGKIWYRNAL